MMKVKKEDHMIIGTIRIRNCYGDADIQVEILSKGPRPGTTWVKAIGNLEPFTKISHGGPFQASTELVSRTSLKNVHFEKHLDEKPVRDKVGEPEVKKPQRVPAWFLESAYESRVGDE